MFYSFSFPFPFPALLQHESHYEIQRTQTSADMSGSQGSAGMYNMQGGVFYGILPGGGEVNCVGSARGFAWDCVRVKLMFCFGKSH